MNYQLCVCLTEKTLSKCILETKKIKSNLIEHRIDYMNKIHNLEKIYSSKKKFIATCRNTSCGGKFKGTEKERIQILCNAIDSGAKYVDIEVETEKKLKEKIIEKAKNMDCKVIISMHNFKKTPCFNNLLKIIKKQKKDGADIGKIVAITNSPKDANNLLNLIFEGEKINLPIIAFGMGEKAKFSRVISLLYGSPFTFVTNNKSSAPGQIEFNKMIKLLKDLD